MNKFSYDVEKDVFEPDSLSNVNVTIVFTSMGLGFCLSLLFFMDQNISGAMVNSPENRFVGRASDSMSVACWSAVAQR